MRRNVTFKSWLSSSRDDLRHDHGASGGPCPAKRPRHFGHPYAMLIRSAWGSTVPSARKTCGPTSRYRDARRHPVSIYPNAGLPNEFGGYDDSPESMAESMNSLKADSSTSPAVAAARLRNISRPSRTPSPARLSNGIGRDAVLYSFWPRATAL